jgi:hypothetical protein
MATVLVAPPVRTHSVTLLVLHVVWSTSRRSPMLEPAIDGPLAALLRRKASELQCCVLGVGARRITFTSSFSNVAAGSWSSRR